MDARRFAQAIGLLARGFGKEADDLMLEAYRVGCEGVPVDLVERGVKDALQTAKFMPSPAELCGRVSLRRPGRTHCACGLALSFAASIRRGFCRSCWRALGGEAEDRERQRLLDGEKRKELTE